MEDLQLVIFVIGAIAILVVLIHGFWSIRKQQPRSLKEQPRNPYAMSPGRRDAEGFDADGIGEVRVRKVQADDKPGNESAQSAPVFGKAHKIRAAHKPAAVAETSAETAQPEAEPEPEPEFTLSDEPRVRRGKERQEPMFGQQQATGDQVQLGLLDDLPEPQVADDYRGDEDDDDLIHARATVTSPQSAAHSATVAPQQQAAPKQEQKQQQKQEDVLPEPRDVLVLHVVAREGQVLAGAELLPCLLELNFKYGDMEIFHRHEDNAGTGKVLFSVANMLKPGIFDPDTMEQFNTHGIVLFMTLPCHGEAVMNFSLMLNSACQLADDLDALVLDGQRQLWSDTTKAQYLARIRANA
ncbi:cell division protein ZipA [Shewanella sp.]|uniref:cell division protein ZipA n=1 Tax=Shewanella sp. TaxID=50422 RepID=UPI003564A4BA